MVASRVKNGDLIWPSILIVYATICKVLPNNLQNVQSLLRESNRQGRSQVRPQNLPTEQGLVVQVYKLSQIMLNMLL